MSKKSERIVDAFDIFCKNIGGRLESSVRKDDVETYRNHYEVVERTAHVCSLGDLKITMMSSDYHEGAFYFELEDKNIKVGPTNAMDKLVSIKDKTLSLENSRSEYTDAIELEYKDGKLRLNMDTGS